MFYYAQVENNVVVGISQLTDKVEFENMIDISGLEVMPQLGYIYDPASKSFSEPIIEEPTEPIETIDEKVKRLEQNGLVSIDISLAVYEQMLVMQEELRQLKLSK